MLKDKINLEGYVSNTSSVIYKKFNSCTDSIHVEFRKIIEPLYNYDALNGIYRNYFRKKGVVSNVSIASKVRSNGKKSKFQKNT